MKPGQTYIPANQQQGRTIESIHEGRVLYSAGIHGSRYCSMDAFERWIKTAGARLVR